MDSNDGGYYGVTPLEVKEAWESWIPGHHIMHIQLGWMRDLLHRAKQRLTSGDTAGGEHLMSRFRRLLVASGATMRYTGSFREQVYLQFIRPAMPPGDFSGVYNIEHTAMQRALGDVKRFYKGQRKIGCPFAKLVREDGLPDPAEMERAAHEPGESGLLAAEIAILDQHGAVCRGAVSNEPSLMDSSSREFNSETQAGWEKLLSRLKTKLKQLSQGAKHAA